MKARPVQRPGCLATGARPARLAAWPASRIAASIAAIWRSICSRRCVFCRFSRDAVRTFPRFLAAVRSRTAPATCAPFAGRRLRLVRRPPASARSCIAADQMPSTKWRQSGILMNVHPVLRGDRQSFSNFSFLGPGPDGQPIESFTARAIFRSYCIVSCGGEIVGAFFGVKRRRASAMACQRSGMVRAAAARSRALSLAKAISMGLKSGL